MISHFFKEYICYFFYYFFYYILICFFFYFLYYLFYYFFYSLWHAIDPITFPFDSFIEMPMLGTQLSLLIGFICYCFNFICFSFFEFSFWGTNVVEIGVGSNIMIINFALISYFLIQPSISGFIIFACKPIQFQPITGYSTIHSELTTLQTVFNRLRGTFSFLEALIIAISMIF